MTAARRRHPVIEPDSNVRLLRPLPRASVYDQDVEHRRAFTLSLTDLEWSLLVADLRRPDAPQAIHDLGDTICTQLRTQHTRPQQVGQ